MEPVLDINRAGLTYKSKGRWIAIRLRTPGGGSHQGFSPPMTHSELPHTAPAGMRARIGPGRSGGTPLPLQPGRRSPLRVGSARWIVHRIQHSGAFFFRLTLAPIDALSVAFGALGMVPGILVAYTFAHFT